MRALRTDSKKACSHASREAAPQLISEMEVVSETAAVGPSAFPRGVHDGSLNDAKKSLVHLLDSAAALRAAASMAVGFFGVRGASEVARLGTKDVPANKNTGVADDRVARQKNGQLGADKWHSRRRFQCGAVRAPLESFPTGCGSANG